jgi:hypothetical protein
MGARRRHAWTGTLAFHRACEATLRSCLTAGVHDIVPVHGPLSTPGEAVRGRRYLGQGLAPVASTFAGLLPARCVIQPGS